MRNLPLLGGYHDGRTRYDDGCLVCRTLDHVRVACGVDPLSDRPNPQSDGLLALLVCHRLHSPGQHHWPMDRRLDGLASCQGADLMITREIDFLEPIARATT